MLLALGIVSLAAWLYLALLHARFWVIEPTPTPPAPPAWPDVLAIVPARDEAAVLPETLGSLFAQDYPGRLRIVVVDDHSTDGTAAAARQAACAAEREADLTVLAAEALPDGWAGKVWAMHQGVTRGLPASARYVLFSDADIHHGPSTVTTLVALAEANGLDLASFMVRLRCQSLPERLMIPAFVFFFRLLYPFPRVNDPRDRMAGAAGGTMLLRREALERIGGMASIRGALIDDCALAREVKRGGRRLWLGLSEESYSTRGYGTLGEVMRMIARSAYTQLGYSPLALTGCVLGLGVTFLAPPALGLVARGPAAMAGAAAWGLMAVLYLPMVRFYRQSPLWAALLPLTATLYLWATVLSAWLHHHGRGGEWKGRAGRLGG